MIIDEVENLVQLIDHKSQLQQNVSHRAGFRTRLDELKMYLEELDQRAAVVKAFTDREFARPAVHGKAHAVLTQVNTTLENFREAPDSIISFNSVVFKSSLRSLSSTLDEYISESWRNYTDKVRHINPDVLAGLGNISVFAGIVQRIKLLMIQIEICRRTFPNSEADFERFDGLVRDAETAWEETGSTDLPEEVEAFLRLAGSREGSPLELLTHDVVEWLAQKQLDKSFRIFMTSSENIH